MFSKIQHVNNMSRPDGGPKPFRSENAVHKLTYNSDTDTYTLDVTDRHNPEFRACTSISTAELDAAKNAVVTKEIVKPTDITP